MFRTWGGRRVRAGRPPTPGRRRVAHRVRGPHDTRVPVHVTMRAVAAIPSLRSAAVFSTVRRALGASSHDGFRLIHFSVQADHLHLLVEADRRDGIARGCQGLAIRLAKAVNRILGRRGTVWGDRYHARALRTPRELRNALAYVLNNWRKHVPGARGLDRRSSGPWFGGWSTAQPQPVGPSPVVSPRTWLARRGWLRHGRIDPHEGPRRSRHMPR
jgi:REP-associated tyrosine transposase